MPSTARRCTAAVLSLVALAACDTGDGRTLDPPVFPPPDTTVPETLPGSEPTVVETAAAPLQLVAPWRDGAPVPVRNTCDGDDLSPALTWADVPPDAVELAVSVTDVDAPDYVHWIVFGIDVATTGLAEGAPPEGASLWPNGGGTGDYVGPCPPAGSEHRYLFTVHALNQQLEPADDMAATEVIELLNVLAIDQSTISGTYARAE